MSAIDGIMADLPMSQLAAQLGVDEQTATSATGQQAPAPTPEPQHQGGILDMLTGMLGAGRR